nr:Rid family hydrolase [uncultured Desulfobacter sp.]
MKYHHGSTQLEYSVFSNNGVDEIHLLITPQALQPYKQQLSELLNGLDDFITPSWGIAPVPVFIRFFVSDYANQTDLVPSVRETFNGRLAECALSVVQQPPLTGQKVAAWVYLVKCSDAGIGKKQFNGVDATVLSRNGYAHCWTAGLMNTNGAHGSYEQTDTVFKSYQTLLEKDGMSLQSNCIRTWLFVKDVDFNYQGVVDARRKYFETLGMTPETHYIASTGIEGRYADPGTSVLMDAYSISGLHPGQIRHLKAPDMLNPTHEYGVTFERGTSVDYGDRRHIFISGTASIDRYGQVVHKGNVAKQTRRTLDNIQALLAEAGADMAHVRHLIVYLRDVSDRTVVDTFFREHYPDIPRIIVLAPVCRPEWLIEMECMAVMPVSNPQFNDF